MSQDLHSVDELADRVVAALAEPHLPRRVVVGLVGEPGSGKSTVAEALAAELGSRDVRTAVVPMDGFHLATVELTRLGLAGRKGAPETFDAAGYAALLTRVRTGGDETVYAPAFERSIEEPVAGSIPVPGDTVVVLTEGNYLLLPDDRWRPVRDLLDLSCAIRVDPVVRRERLVARHVRFGRSPAEAEEWVSGVDDPNAELTRRSMSLADLALHLA